MRHIACIVVLAVVLGSYATPGAAADVYTIDTANSSVGFSVQHMLISKVRGAFADFGGTITYDPKNMANSSVEVTIKTASVNTNNARRDKDLCGSDFLDADQYPTITFKSKRIEKRGDRWVAVGDFTLRGVTKEIELPFQVNGPITTPWGAQVIGVSVDPVTIKRLDYGVSWSKKLDNGTLVASNDVELELHVEASRKP